MKSTMWKRFAAFVLAVTLVLADKSALISLAKEDFGSPQVELQQDELQEDELQQDEHQEDELQQDELQQEELQEDELQQDELQQDDLQEDELQWDELKQDEHLEDELWRDELQWEQYIPEEDMLYEALEPDTDDASYANLSNISFTVKDIRTGIEKTYNGSAGKNAVFVFGGNDTPTSNAIATMSDLASYLDSNEVDFFAFKRGSTSDEAFRSMAKNMDPAGNLHISSAYDGLFSRCYSATVGGGSIYLPLIVYVDRTGTIYDYSTSSVSLDQILASLVAGGVSDTYSGITISPNVERHSMNEIREFIKSHPVQYLSPQYKETYSRTQPYKAGALNDATLQDALNMVNQIRYIAGLSYNVTLDDEYSRLAQAASLVNCVNNELTHYPVQPSGMDKALYDEGAAGARRSNIAVGFGNLASSIISGYMYDGDASNLSVVGHRRWILNPAMGKTGFGQVGTYSAMYAHDSSGTVTGKNSMWPALNMPVEYFGRDYPWSYSTGNAESSNSVKVVLTKTGTGQQWTFSSGSKDGYFNVENGGYGLSGCIIFRPNSVTYSDGDVFNVKISGLAANQTVEYDVHFFGIDGNTTDPVIQPSGVTLNQTSASINSGDTLQLIATVNPQNASNKEVEWTSSNKNVATVNSTGRVVGIAEGTAVITVKTKDGGKTATCTVSVKMSKEDQELVAGGTMFRLYNPNSGEHFYTGSTVERNTLIAEGWDYEGSAWRGPTVSNTPVYRLYNPNAGDHHYTTSMEEKNNLVAVGWEYEGIGWYSDDNLGIPLYRLYNPNAVSGSHHYTASVEERDNLVKVGWKYEGIAWYGMR